MARIGCLTIVSAGLVALGADGSFSTPATAARQGPFRDVLVLQRRRKALICGLDQDLFLVSGLAAHLRIGPEGRSEMRDRLLGNCPERARKSARAATAKNLADGSAAIEAGKSLGAKTQRERDYIDALSRFYADHEKVDHRTRVQAYLKAMEDLVQRYPKDDEAKIAYAIALNVAASPVDKTYTNQLKGAALLEPIFKRQPNHPGRSRTT